MKALYIFDLDGTLCDIKHRLHFIGGEKPQWNAFYDACGDDQPKYDVIKIMDDLISTGADIWILSGRQEQVREKTLLWLHLHTNFRCYDNPHALMMRPSFCTKPDTVLKATWLKYMLEIDRKRLVACFDDRNRIVDMYRSHGVTCFQVQPGDY